MSLIDEALKRAELEAARRDGLRGGPYPWVPEHMPPRRRRWVLVVVVAAMAGVAAGGVMWLSRRPPAVPGPRFQVPGGRGEALGSRSRVPGREMETVEVAPPPAGLPSRALGPGKSSRAAAPGEEPKQPGAAPSDTARGKRAPTVEASSKSTAEGRSTGPAAEAKPAGHGLANGRTYVGEVTVPDGGKIVLEGIVYSETNPVALINGKVLPPGGVVEEFTIVSISSDRVELNGRGFTIFLALK